MAPNLESDALRGLVGQHPGLHRFTRCLIKPWRRMHHVSRGWMLVSTCWMLGFMFTDICSDCLLSVCSQQQHRRAHMSQSEDDPLLLFRRQLQTDVRQWCLCRFKSALQSDELSVAAPLFGISTSASHPCRFWKRNIIYHDEKYNRA